MIRYSNARAHDAHAPIEPTTSTDVRHSALERTRLLETFIAELGYPPARISAVVARFRRERGAMTATEAAERLAEWISAIRDEPVAAEEAASAFILSGAAMWHTETVFADPSTLSAAHRRALGRSRSVVVPGERPLSMPPQSLAIRRGRRADVDPVARRLTWVPSR